MAYLPGERKKECFFGKEIEVEVLDKKDSRGRMMGKLPSGAEIVLDEHFFLEEEKELAPV